MEQTTSEDIPPDHQIQEFLYFTSQDLQVSSALTIIALRTPLSKSSFFSPGHGITTIETNPCIFLLHGDLMLWRYYNPIKSVRNDHFRDPSVCAVFTLHSSASSQTLSDFCYKKLQFSTKIGTDVKIVNRGAFEKQRSTESSKPTQNYVNNCYIQIYVFNILMEMNHSNPPRRLEKDWYSYPARTHLHQVVFEWYSK